MNEILNWRNEDWGIKTQWEGKTDECNCQVSILQYAWVDINYSGRHPWHTHRITNMQSQKCRCNNMHTHAATPADIHIHCKYNFRIPGCFDLLAAVMSLVVKLLFSFNIVYRLRHLLVHTLICPFLRYTMFSLNTVCTHSTAAEHPCHIFDAPIN